MSMGQPFRTYLVVVDDSAEMLVALRYAASRARLSRGRVAMLRVIEPDVLQPWAGVEATLEEDAMVRAQGELAAHEQLVEKISGSKPLVFIRKGRQREVLMQLLQEQQGISVLVLAAQTGDAGPGPLISYLTSAKGIRTLKIPFVIVPDTYEMPADHFPV